MFYVGLDVHSQSSTWCVLNADGKELSVQTMKGDPHDLIARLRRDLPRPFRIVYEASTGYGFLHDQLARFAQRVLVAHPKRLRAIWRSKQKNDRADARQLAVLLFLDQVPTIHVPTLDVRTWRGLIESRGALIHQRTGVKCRIRALLRNHGIRAIKSLFSQSGCRWLRELAVPNAAIHAQLAAELTLLECLQAQVLAVTRQLDEIAKRHPQVALLMTIPGVGPRTAEAVVAYIDNPERFGRNKAIGAYFGMVPSQYASAGQNHLGHITREGPAIVRKLIAEAAWQGIRRDQQIRRVFERFKHGRKDRHKRALVATGHYLLRVMLAMLKSGECWRQTA